MSERKQRKTRTSRYDSDKDAYYQRTYGRTEKEVKEISSIQGGACLGCGATPKSGILHLDHNHKIEKWKVESEKRNGIWLAWPDGYRPPCSDSSSRLAFVVEGKTKSETIRKAKRKLLRLSSRALLCWFCNSSLKHLRDNANIARRLAGVLDRHNDFLNGNSTNSNGFKE